MSICRTCAREFVPDDPRYSTYCTRKCSANRPELVRRRAANRERRELQWLAGRFDKALRTPEPIPQFCHVSFRRCWRCDTTFAARSSCRRSCYNGCATSAPRNQSRTVRCMGCLVSFVTTYTRKVYCSKRCTADRRLKNYRKRARVLGLEYESINVYRVFDRDGWRCQLCGKDTPPHRRGTRYPNAPELDHRVPMSKGGGHTYANVQCACKACNQAKGNRTTAGQLPLLVENSTGGRENLEKRTFQ